MAYTFLKALGEQVGRSLVEEDKIDLAQRAGVSADWRSSRALLRRDTAVKTTRLQIDLTAALRLTVPCDRRCGTLRDLAAVARLAVRTAPDACEAWRTA